MHKILPSPQHPGKGVQDSLPSRNPRYQRRHFSAVRILEKPSQEQAQSHPQLPHSPLKTNQYNPRKKNLGSTTRTGDNLTSKPTLTQQNLLNHYTQPRDLPTRNPTSTRNFFFIALLLFIYYISRLCAPANIVLHYLTYPTYPTLYDPPVPITILPIPPPN